MRTTLRRHAPFAITLFAAWAGFAAPLAAQREDAAALARTLDAFGAKTLDLLPSDNLCYSPASAALALLLCEAGARGDTRQELLAALAPADWSDARLHAAAAYLQRRLARNDKDFLLACAQDAWPQQGLEVLPEYAELLRNHYDLTLQPLDFRGDVEHARQRINAHIATVTRDRIPELLQPGDVAASTRLVLTNALYLKAKWLAPFEAAQTKERPFQLAKGESVLVPTMHGTAPRATMSDATMTVVRLPYAGGTFALDLALPADGVDLDATLRALVADATWRKALAAEPLQVALPRFQMENRMVLNDALAAIGIRTAFTDRADFSAILGPSGALRIDVVLQQSWIAVDEAGTEAAAATATTWRGGRPKPARAVAFDRPFAYALRDLETGLLLFAGRCTDPRSTAPKGAAKSAPAKND